MDKKVDLRKDVYNKSQYLKTIDTRFRELGTKTIAEIVDEQPSVEEFFELYNTLFYDIPPQGTNSHEFLIEQSGDYINYEENQEEISALRDEIAQLRRENLNLQLENVRLISGESNNSEIAQLNDELNQLSQDIN